MIKMFFISCGYKMHHGINQIEKSERFKLGGVNVRTGERLDRFEFGQV